MLTDRSYRQQIWVGISNGASHVASQLSEELESVAYSMKRDMSSILLNTVAAMGRDLLKLETWTNIAYELLAIEQFYTALNADAPVDQRIVNFFLGYA